MLPSCARQPTAHVTTEPFNFASSEGEGGVGVGISRVQKTEEFECGLRGMNSVCGTSCAFVSAHNWHGPSTDASQSSQLGIASAVQPTRAGRGVARQTLPCLGWYLFSQTPVSHHGVASQINTNRRSEKILPCLIRQGSISPNTITDDVSLRLPQISWHRMLLRNLPLGTVLGTAGKT